MNRFLAVSIAIVTCAPAVTLAQTGPDARHAPATARPGPAPSLQTMQPRRAPPPTAQPARPAAPLAQPARPAAPLAQPARPVPPMNRPGPAPVLPQTARPVPPSPQARPAPAPARPMFERQAPAPPSFGQRPYDQRANDQRTYDQRPYNQRPYYQSPYNQPPYNQRTYDQRRFDDRRYDTNRYDRRYDTNRSYGRRFDANRYYDRGGFSARRYFDPRGRRFFRPRVDIDIVARPYYQLHRFRRFGTWGLPPTLVAYPYLSFLQDALLVGSYYDEDRIVYIYIIDEDGVQREFRVDEYGNILSETIAPSYY
jgi:hypothetical protein